MPQRPPARCTSLLAETALVRGPCLPLDWRCPLDVGLGSSGGDLVSRSCSLLICGTAWRQPESWSDPDSAFPAWWLQEVLPAHRASACPAERGQPPSSLLGHWEDTWRLQYQQLSSEA